MWKPVISNPRQNSVREGSYHTSDMRGNGEIFKVKADVAIGRLGKEEGSW